MSWQDDARANGYVQATLNANNDRELEQGMQAVDKGIDMIGNVVNGIGRALTEPSPPPKTSSGGGLGGLLLVGALAGGAYFLSKAFGSDDKPKSTNLPNNNSSKQSEYPETEW